MVDAIVREWIFQMEASGFGTANIRDIAAVFSADDGLISARDPTLLQGVFDLLTALFDRVSLETNNSKTKVMVFLLGRICTCLSKDAYLSRLDALRWSSKKAGNVECHIYWTKFQKLSLAFHLTTKHGVFHSHLLAGRTCASPWASRGSCGHTTSPPRVCGSAPCRTARLVTRARGRRVSRPCACTSATATPTILWAWTATSSPAVNGVGCRHVTWAPPATSPPPLVAVGRRGATGMPWQRAERPLWSTPSPRTPSRCVARRSSSIFGHVIAYDDSNFSAALRQLACACGVWGRLCNVIAKEGVPAPVSAALRQQVVDPPERTACPPGGVPCGVLPEADGYAAAQARGQVGLSEVHRHAASRGAPAAALLQPETEVNCGQNHRDTPRP